VSETKPRYARTVVHSPTYYHAVLLLLIAGLQADESHAQMAQRLTDAGQRTPTGGAWSAGIVKTTLFRIRNYRQYRSQWHYQLLQLIVSKLMTVRQSQVLYDQRLTGVM
jgi:hypothetical protein